MNEVISVILAIFLGVSSVLGGSVQLPKSDAAKEKPAQTQEVTQEVTQEQKEPEAPQKVGYGRILLVGDSRSVDMFTGDQGQILGGVYDGITVYCRDAEGFGFLEESISAHGMDNFDTLLTLMGCNSYGDFSKYGPYYDSLIAQGKTIVVCTVGPTADQYLASDFDKTHYENTRQIQFNNSLVAWAQKRGVKIIDLYSYINNSSSIIISEADGIHFFPQPTTELWNYIKANLK